jgi:hypothetical protein
MASITVEVPQEYTVQEIGFDGTEVRQNPPSMTESLTKLAHKIDFGDYEDGEEDVSASAAKDSADRDASKPGTYRIGHNYTDVKMIVFRCPRVP